MVAKFDMWKLHEIAFFYFYFFNNSLRTFVPVVKSPIEAVSRLGYTTRLQQTTFGCNPTRNQITIRPSFFTTRGTNYRK